MVYPPLPPHFKSTSSSSLSIPLSPSDLEVGEGPENQLHLAHVRVQAQAAGLRAHHLQVDPHVAVARRPGGKF